MRPMHRIFFALGINFRFRVRWLLESPGGTLIVPGVEVITCSSPAPPLAWPPVLEHCEG